MLCQNCKKNTATVYFKENINGQVSEYSLCSECAAKMKLGKQISMFEDDPISQLFSGLMARPRSIQEQKKCPLCSQSFNELAASGKVGCPKCYEVFSAELEPTVHRLHGGAKPNGRAPKRYGAKRERETKLLKLRTELKEAIDTQEFEKAAALRDKIREIEAE